MALENMAKGGKWILPALAVVAATVTLEPTCSSQKENYGNIRVAGTSNTVYADSVAARKAAQFFEQKYGQKATPLSATETGITDATKIMKGYTFEFINPQDPSKRIYIYASNPPAGYYDTVFQAATGTPLDVYKPK